MDATTRIKLALDHRLPTVRAGLEATLAELPDIALLQGWRSSQGMQALDADTRVLVLDGEAGLRLAAELRRGAGPQRCHVMIVTDHVGEWEIRQAVAQGVLGFYLLDSPLERIVAGVHQLAHGSRSFDDAVAARMAECLLQPVLTEREQDVMTLVAGGLCNKEVAKRLGIALGTVKGHVRVVLDKLGVSTRVQAVIVARQRGLVSQPEARWLPRPRAGAAAQGALLPWRPGGGAAGGAASRPSC